MTNTMADLLHNSTVQICTPHLLTTMSGYARSLSNSSQSRVIRSRLTRDRSWPFKIYSRSIVVYSRFSRDHLRSPTTHSRSLPSHSRFFHDRKRSTRDRPRSLATHSRSLVVHSRFTRGRPRITYNLSRFTRDAFTNTGGPHTIIYDLLTTHSRLPFEA